MSIDPGKLAREMHDGAMFACTSPDGHAYADCSRSRGWWAERASRAIRAGEQVAGGLTDADPGELGAALHDTAAAPCEECDRRGARSPACGWRSRGRAYYTGKAKILRAAANRAA